METQDTNDGRTVEYFGERPGREHRAVQAWQVLVALAHNRQTVTYERLSEILDFGNARTVKHALDPIFRYCMENTLPPLTGLVLLKHDGIPGEGFVGAYPNFPAALAQVYNHDWYAVYPPTSGQFADLIGR